MHHRYLHMMSNDSIAAFLHFKRKRARMNRRMPTLVDALRACDVLL